MARAIRSGRKPRASGQLAYHVLDTMLAIEESIASGAPVEVASTVEDVTALPGDWNPAERTL
jgi:hypothetical protein